MVRMRWLVTGTDTEPVELMLSAIAFWLGVIILLQVAKGPMAYSGSARALDGAAGPLGFCSVALGILLLLAVIWPLPWLRTIIVLAHVALWTGVCFTLLFILNPPAPAGTGYGIVAMMAIWVFLRLVWSYTPTGGGRRGRG